MVDKKTEDAKRYVDEVYMPMKEREMEKNLKKFQKIIQTEKDLLAHFHPDRLTLKVVYDDVVLKFKIRPLTGSDDLETIGLDFNTYTDLDELEKSVMQKKNSGQKLNKKEKNVYKSMEDKLTSKMRGDVLEQTHHILASFLTPPSYNKTKDEKKRYSKKLVFWQGMPLDLKMHLFNEVIHRLGLNPESDVKLFQTN